MNSQQRLHYILTGQPVGRVPNFDIFMMGAAHHIGVPLSQYYLDHRVLCAANLAGLQDFALDIVQVISDPYREAVDIGLAVEFPEDNLPLNKKPLIVERDDLKQLHFSVKNFGARMTDRLNAVHLLPDLAEA